MKREEEEAKKKRLQEEEKAKIRAAEDEKYLEKRKQELKEYIDKKILDKNGEYKMDEVRRRGMVKDKDGKYVMPETDADEVLDYHLFIGQQPTPAAKRTTKLE